MTKDRDNNRLLPISGGIFLFAGLISSSDTFALTLQDDAASTDEDTPIVIDVLSNDVADNGATINSTSLQITSAPENGRAEVQNGKLIYQGNHNFNGSDSLSYQVSDSDGLSQVATVTLNIAAVNDRPLLTSNEEIHVQQGQSFTYQATASDVDSNSSFQFGYNSKAGFSNVSGGNNRFIFTQQNVGLTSFAARPQPGGQSYSIQVISHGDVADLAVVQQLPAAGVANQQQTLTYQLKNTNPYFSDNSDVSLSIELRGELTVNQLPESCSQQALANNVAGVAISCNSIQLVADTPQVRSLIITPSATGFIDSSASVANLNGEARTTNNSSAQRLAIIGSTLANANEQVSVNTAAAALASVDADGDGDLDILLAPGGFAQPVWFINNGQGRLSQGNSLFGAIDAIEIITADLDNDNINEIVLLSRNGAIQQYSRSGTGYVLKVAISEWDNQLGDAFARSAVIRDLNNDNYPELVIAGNNKTPVFPNNNGVLENPVQFRNGGINNFAVAIGDFNNDQQVDLIYPDTKSATRRWVNNGSGDLNSNLTYQPWQGAYPLSVYRLAAALDLNNDNYDDLILHRTNERNDDTLYREQSNLQRIHQLRFFTNNGQAGIPAAPTSQLDVPELFKLSHYDFDNDNDQDVFLTTEQGAGLLLANQQGSLSLGSFGVQLPLNAPYVIADLNQDGFSDLITASVSNSPNLQSFINPLGTPLPPQQGVISISENGGGSLPWYWIISLLVITFAFRRNQPALCKQ